MLNRFLLTVIITLSSPYCLRVEADDYQDRILPYLKSYCMECHAGEKAKGELDLEKYAANGDVVANFRRWKHVMEFIRQGEMPPEDSQQPSIGESNDVVAAIESILIEEAKKRAGDPGVVLPRRLSNTEYNHAIHDLTGVDIQPTKSFPADPAGGEGFDNTGEALRMSPNLLKKYLAAAQHVSDHMVLKPDGIEFAPFPVLSYNERKKLTEQAVIDFYENHAVDVSSYLEAAWRYQHSSPNRQDQSVEAWATENSLSPTYLALVCRFIDHVDEKTAWGAEFRRHWDALPSPPEIERPIELRDLVKFMDVSRQLLASPEPELIKPGAGNWPISHLDFRDNVANHRDQFDRSVLKSDVLVKTDQIAARNKTSPKSRSLFLQFDHGFSTEPAFVVIEGAIFSEADRLPRNDQERTAQKVETLSSVLKRFAPDALEALKYGQGPAGEEISPDSFVVKVPATIEIPLNVDLQNEFKGRRLLLPCKLDKKNSPNGSVFVQATLDKPPSQRWAKGVQHLIVSDSPIAKELSKTGSSYCDTFPNRFFYVNDSRGLAAGFHLVEGFFRDDQPLVKKILSDSENAELDRLWRELEFVTESTETLLRGFVWFERSEREVLHDERFDFLRSEDPKLVEEELLGKFERLYLDKMGVKRIDDTLEAENPDDKYVMIHRFFNKIRGGLTKQQSLLQQAEQRGIADIESFAIRAWRRPLRMEEKLSLTSLYEDLRAEGQTVEGALRGVLIAVLMSPHFCYFIPKVPEGPQVSPLSDADLASRLSLFLWSSIPDETLLTAATQHQLQSEEQLVAQAKRMLNSPKVSALAQEFLGQWLRYRDYLDKDPINADAFAGYDDELREAMAEEPVRLATYLIQHDRPITELLTSDETFVNQRLAAHYGAGIQQQYAAQLSEFHENRERSSDIWFRVHGIRDEGRGGLLGMGVVLTKNSSGERTSPVKRGFWTVHHLLGQHFPPPPADVPELPKSEKEATHTIRELLAKHVEDTKCAMCHKHFDGLGLVMEGFDAIGRRRTIDSAGRKIDNRSELPNGESAQGIPELIDYIQQHRQDAFVKTFCRKFLGYALGRSVILSDEPLLSEMELALKRHDYRFSALFETVILSPQFRKHRGHDVVVGP